MLAQWLQIGDRAFSFAAPKDLLLAFVAPIFVVLAVVAHVRRRRAARAGWPVPAAWRLWLATLLRTAAYLCVVAAISGVTLVETEREDRLTVVAVQDASQSISRFETSWMRNWLDPADHKEGGIYGRWFDCDSEPLPIIKRVKLAELRDHLPSDTPVVTAEERAEELRIRVRACQRRRRW